MVLSGRDIRELVKRGDLRFDPPLSDDQFQQNGVDMILGSAEAACLAVGEFALGATAERISMPDDLMAFVQLRSTWARCGLMLPPTVIDAGFSGQVTLEIVSFREQALPVGQRFAHLIFVRLSSFADPYRGKYQGQAGITHAILDLT